MNAAWRFGPAVLAAVFVLAILTAWAAADMVTLVDGRTFTGKVTKDNADVVVINTMISGVKSTLQFNRAEVETVTKGPLPADFFEPEKKAAPPAEEATAGPGDDESVEPIPGFSRFKPSKPEPKTPESITGTAYIEVPLVGVFGHEIRSDAVAKVLEYADKHAEVKHIVFTLDSDGGYLISADAIFQTMRKYDRRFKFHVIVKKAISASIWVVFASDDIFAADGSVIGGAVAFQETDMGNAEVNTKLNSILAASVGAIAETKNRPVALVRAMMSQEAELYAWRDRDGSVRFAQKLDPRVAPENLLIRKNNKQVLTLTKQEAVDIGLASSFNGGASQLGEELGIKDWVAFNDYGQWVMEASAEFYKKMEKLAKKQFVKLKEVYAKIKQDEEEAKKNDPSKFRDYGVKDGKFTDAGRQLWTQRTDRAVGALERARRGWTEFRSMENENEKNGLPRAIPDDIVKNHVDEVGRDILQLQQNRFRAGP